MSFTDPAIPTVAVSVMCGHILGPGAATATQTQRAWQVAEAGLRAVAPLILAENRPTAAEVLDATAQLDVELSVLREENGLLRADVAAAERRGALLTCESIASSLDAQARRCDDAARAGMVIHATEAARVFRDIARIVRTGVQP